MYKNHAVKFKIKFEFLNFLLKIKNFNIYSKKLSKILSYIINY